jgi:hypothetical protein
MRRRIVFIVSSLVALAVVIVAARSSSIDDGRATHDDRRAPSVARTVDEERAHDGPRLAPLAGETWRMALRYEAETRGAPLGDAQSVDGTVLFDGEVDLTVLRVDGPRARFAASIANCEEARVIVLSSALLDPAMACKDALVGTLLIDVDTDGQMQGVRASGEQPTIGTRVLEAIASDLLFPLPRTFDSASRTDDETPRGVVTAMLVATRVSEGVDVHGVLDDTIARARVPGIVEHVVGERHLFVREGRMAMVTTSETLTGQGIRATMSLDARLVDVLRSAHTPSALLAVETAPLFSTDDTRMTARLTDERISGLTPREVKDALALVNAGGEPGDFRRFLWRATALVGRDDALARDVGVFAQSSSTETRGRTLAVDLLAQAGSAAAERALLAALDSEAARADRHHALHVQRIAFVERPSSTMADTVLTRLAAEANPSVRAAWLTGAGAVAASIDDSTRVARLHAELRAGLTADGELLVAALLGVGNARSTALAESAVPFVEHEIAGVRAAAIEAVVDGGHPLAAMLIATAARDGTAMVQRSALRALDRHLAPAIAVTTVAELVDEGVLRRDNVRVAIDLLKHHGMADLAHAQAALTTIVADLTLSGEERAAARALQSALDRGGFGKQVAREPRVIEPSQAHDER